MSRIIRILEAVAEWVGIIFSWLSLGLVLLVCFKLLLRAVGITVLEQSLTELEWHFFAWIFLFGAAYTLKHDAHVRVDVFYSRFSKKQKAWVNLLGTLLFLIPLGLVITIESWAFAQAAFGGDGILPEESPEQDGLPYRFVVKGSIAIGFALLVIQGIANILTAVQSLLTTPSPSANA